MSVDKYKITRLINRKPIEISKMQTIEKDGGIVMNYHNTVITQIVEAQEKVEFERICAEIQKFIEENNIDICYVINKSELVDCLQEHQILKLEIAELEAKLVEMQNEKDELISKYRYWKGECAELKQQLAEKDKEIKKLKQLVKAVDIYNQYSKDAKNLILLNLDNCYANGHKAVIKVDKQDKINYAVEQLEKVKDLATDYFEFHYCEECGETDASDVFLRKEEFTKLINQLITEIKEGK